MAINIIIRVLDRVSGEAQLSPVPPMYPDKAPPATKRERQAPPDCSGFWGGHVRKQKELGGEIAPNVCTWLQCQKQGGASFVWLSVSLPVSYFLVFHPYKETYRCVWGRFPETLVKWSCSLIRWQFPNHLFISTKHQVVYITTNTTSDLSLRILKVIQTTKQWFPQV